MKKKKLKIITFSITVLILLIAVRYMTLDIKAEKIIQNCFYNWKSEVTYDMLSDNLKIVVSEEEFKDRTNTGRYNMYRKLEKLELEHRKIRSPFSRSTRGYKTPPFIAVEANGKRYGIEYQIDFRINLFTGIKVINFETYFYD